MSQIAVILADIKRRFFPARISRPITQHHHHHHHHHQHKANKWCGLNHAYTTTEVMSIIKKQQRKRRKLIYWAYVYIRTSVAWRISLWLLGYLTDVTELDLDLHCVIVTCTHSYDIGAKFDVAKICLVMYTQICFGTSCLLHCAVTWQSLLIQKTVEDVRICLSRTRLRRLVTLAFRRRILILLLTYLRN